MDDDASEFLDSRQPVCEHFRIATRIENNPAKPGESHDRQKTSDGEKPDRKTDGRYRIIARGFVRDASFNQDFASSTSLNVLPFPASISGDIITRIWL